MILSIYSTQSTPNTKGHLQTVWACLDVKVRDPFGLALGNFFRLQERILPDLLEIAILTVPRPTGTVDQQQLSMSFECISGRAVPLIENSREARTIARGARRILIVNSERMWAALLRRALEPAVDANGDITRVTSKEGAGPITDHHVDDQNPDYGKDKDIFRPNPKS